MERWKWGKRKKGEIEGKTADGDLLDSPQVPNQCSSYRNVFHLFLQERGVHKSWTNAVYTYTFCFHCNLQKTNKQTNKMKTTTNSQLYKSRLARKSLGLHPGLRQGELWIRGFSLVFLPQNRTRLVRSLRWLYPVLDQLRDWSRVQ